MMQIMSELTCALVHDKERGVRLIGELRELSIDILGYDTLTGERDPFHKE